MADPPGENAVPPALLRDTSTVSDPSVVKASLSTLPGEIKNRIYRFACVQETAILVRSTKTSDTTRRLNFETLAFALTCREMNHAVSSFYYEKNTFLFTDGIMTPNAIAAFERLCGDSADRITSVKVTCKPIPDSSNNVRFEAKFVNGGLMICSPKDSRDVRDYETPWNLLGKWMNGRKGCYCNIFGIADSFRSCLQVYGSQPRNPIFAFLQSYAEAICDQTQWCWDHYLDPQVCTQCHGHYYTKKTS